MSTPTRSLFCLYFHIPLFLLLILLFFHRAQTFPLLILLLVPLRRYILPKFFSEHHLRELDAEEEVAVSDSLGGIMGVIACVFVRLCAFVLGLY